MVMRRVRGALLRLVRRRVLVAMVGLACVVPAAWLELGSHQGAWWVDPLSLIVGATGAALLWTGLVGLRPDYIDEES